MPEQRQKRKYERDEPVSLAPLDFREALGALLKVRPEEPVKPERKKPAAKRPRKKK